MSYKPDNESMNDNTACLIILMFMVCGLVEAVALETGIIFCMGIIAVIGACFGRQN